MKRVKFVLFCLLVILANACAPLKVINQESLILPQEIPKQKIILNNSFKESPRKIYLKGVKERVELQEKYFNSIGFYSIEKTIQTDEIFGEGVESDKKGIFVSWNKDFQGNTFVPLSDRIIKIGEVCDEQKGRTHGFLSSKPQYKESKTKVLFESKDKIRNFVWLIFNIWKPVGVALKLNNEGLQSRDISSEILRDEKIGNAKRWVDPTYLILKFWGVNVNFQDPPGYRKICEIMSQDYTEYKVMIKNGKGFLKVNRRWLKDSFIEIYPQKPFIYPAPNNQYPFGVLFTEPDEFSNYFERKGRPNQMNFHFVVK